MTATDAVATRLEAPAAGLGGLVWLAAATAAAGLFFQEGILALTQAWQTAEYSHGPLIPVLSGYLFLRQLRGVPPEPGPVADRGPGLLVLVGALLLGLLGKLAGIADVVAYALIVWVGGIVLVSFGWRRGLQFWPPVLHLAFMLPLPATLYYKMSTTLQMISSEIGVLAVQAAGVRAHLDGNVITLGPHKLHVAEACSGLRYLFPILSFSYIFAVLFRGPMWHKAVLLLSAAPIAVLMNSFRIGVVGVMVEHFGIEHAEGFSHFMEGWVVFIACVALLFGLARLLLALQPRPVGLVEALDLDTTAIAPQLARLRLVRPSGALIAATCLFAGATAVWAAAPPRATPQIVRESLLFFPVELEDWRAIRSEVLPPEIRDVLAADDYRSIAYGRAGEAAGVDLFIAWYADQTRGGIHSPEICLPSSGWEIEAIDRVDVGEALGLAEAWPINRAVVQRGLDRVMTYYWFEQYGGRMAWDFAAKVALIWSGLEHGRTDGALVRATTPILPGESDAEAEARLRRLLVPAIGALPRFVPRASGDAP
jgi:exosortase D (VPLPA-CTERM-specific)